MPSNRERAGLLPGVVRSLNLEQFADAVNIVEGCRVKETEGLLAALPCGMTVHRPEAGSLMAALARRMTALRPVPCGLKPPHTVS